MSKGIYAHFLPAPSFDIDDLLLKRIERRSARYYTVGWALIQKWLPIDLILWSIESQNVLLKKFIWFPLGYLRVIEPRSQLATIFGLWPTLRCNCKKNRSNGSSYWWLENRFLNHEIFGWTSAKIFGCLK